MVPVRGVVLGFAATLYDTVPAPVPLAPPVTVIHDAWLAAVHGQPVAAVTAIVPAVAEALTDAPVGAIWLVQTAPACVTLKVCPPIVTVPVRLAVPAFAAML
jgi:hypothetical protein